MSLTGWPIIVLACVLLLAFTVAAVGDVPRIRGPRMLRRAVSVIAAQLCAVLVAALAVNDWGMFYGSWSDLFGGPDNGVVTVGSAGEHRTAEGLPDSMRLTGWSTKAQLTTRGGIFELGIAGVRSHLATKALVFLPPQYFQPQHAGEHFPVVETIAGYPGDVPQLVSRLGYPAALDKAMEKDGVRPMILVMMKPTLVPPRDTECTDVPHGPQTFTFFSEDVPDVLRETLRVTPRGWGAMGHSTGGYCAAKLAVMNPKQFSTAVSLSGHFTLYEDATTGRLFDGSAKVRDENDLTWRVKHLPVPSVAILASMGQDEGGQEGMSDVKAFMAAAKPPMRTKFQVVVDGGHNFNTYARVLPSAYAWLNDNLARS